ncbi:hypothetical protein [Algiphilus sp.]|uniref:hypothetical protein n=1 Tax=Algiphilus sp. TaxID=1872431 RepID=UPI003B522C72
MPVHSLRRLFAACLLFLTASASVYAAAVPTEVTVRVRSHDAKFIGSGVGGLQLRIEDAVTGALLDSGMVTGGTGDTARLMKTPQSRGDALADDKTAHYTSTLMLEAPTQIRIRVTGPLDVPAAIQNLSLTTWVVPGKDITGDGLVLHLPGLIVDAMKLGMQEDTLPLVADITLMCGCPITDGGLWDSADYEVQARIVGPDGAVATRDLAFSGEANRFQGSYKPEAPGLYAVTIWAHNANTGNTGAATYSVHATD